MIFHCSISLYFLKNQVMKKPGRQKKSSNGYKKRAMGLFLSILLLDILSGCALAPKKLHIKDISGSFKPGAIISSQSGMPVSQETLVADLAGVAIVYVGEKHNDPANHEIQLQVIKAIFELRPNLSIGMEMFDHTYQPVLDLWSEGKLDQEAFLKNTHWYANWKFDFDLYRDILNYIRENRIKLVGLNIPFHIPPKIAVGGIESLREDERKHLPNKIDTSNVEHREYVEKIFNLHHVKGVNDFQNFYMAQCVWEDAMAESIALNLKENPMIVLVGNGHMIQKFGVPDRVFARTRVPFRTVYPALSGSRVERSYADYIWVTHHIEEQKRGNRMSEKNTAKGMHQ